MYKAMEMNSSGYVAMKEMKKRPVALKPQSESAVVKECNSEFLVKYIDISTERFVSWVCVVCIC